MSSHKSITIMTWNIYFGAVLTPALGTTPAELLQRATEIFRQFQATNFPVRAKAIAEQIEKKEPDIIGLQEVALWELLLPQNGKVVVKYDFISILQKELEKRGLHYQVLVETRNTDVTVPSSTGFNIRFLDRDVILVRKKPGLKFSNIQSENFQARLPVPVGDQSVPIISGWASVDVHMFGRKFRLVNTHLQPFTDPTSLRVHLAQAEELLTGPAATELPLIFIGDFNSPTDGTGIAYNNFINAGFKDAWKIAGQGDGLTCCQDADLLNLVSQLFIRIDLILFRGNFGVKNIQVIGEEQKDRTSTALWPSDHAGVVATLTLEDDC